jgi:hypothetical protein
MDIASPNYRYARFYKATDPEALRLALSGLEISYNRFTFIDYGSGKGLALLVASLFPFRTILGVEFAADIHKIAEKNITRFQAPDQRCKDVHSIHADAAQWIPPVEPLVCFFYEPFDFPVFTRVIRNLEASYSLVPREIVLIYHEAPAGSVLHDTTIRNRKLIVENGIFSQVHDWSPSHFSVFAAMPQRAETRRDATASAR